MNADRLSSRRPVAIGLAIIAAAAAMVAITVLAVNVHPGSHQLPALPGAATGGSLVELNRSPAGAAGAAEQAVIALAQLVTAPGPERTSTTAVDRYDCVLVFGSGFLGLGLGVVVARLTS